MTTSRLIVANLTLLLCFACAPLAAQEPAAAATPATSDEGDAAELAAIRDSAAEFEKAFNRGNAAAVAAFWTEDGDYIDESGQVYQGRAAIEEAYKKFFKTHKGVKLHLTIESLRLLSDDAAIEDGRAVLAPPPAGAPVITKYTTVHVKVDGKWLMSTVRDVRVETPSAYRQVADLEWLIGKWEAEEHGVKVEAECRWIANKSFLERRFQVKHHDGSTISGVEIIGYNPANGSMQSWTFNAGGGFAIGVWSPLKNGWQADIQGVTGDGVVTTAVNLLIPIDENAYAWKSHSRTANGAALDDTDEVVLKRAAAQ